MAVNNEKDLAWVLPEQTSKKLQEDISPKTLFKHHKIQLPFIGNGRDDTAAKALVCSRDDQRLTTASIGTSYSVIRERIPISSPQ